jgi:DNA-binding transcriptional MerR regulator
MLISQKEAARLCRVTPVTISNWEKKGILRRVRTPRPGAWYEQSDIQAFFLDAHLQPGQVEGAGK